VRRLKTAKWKGVGLLFWLKSEHWLAQRDKKCICTAHLKKQKAALTLL
jgi:hypothetical protein